MSAGQLSPSGKVSDDSHDRRTSRGPVATPQQTGRPSAATKRCRTKKKGRRAPPSRSPAFQKRTSASEIHLAVMSSSRSGDLLEIDFHAWPHRRADAELVHELAFRAR